jgi:hypothetical protein
MDWKQFIASIIGSIAWPVIVVVLLILLRKNLGSLAERLTEISLPGGSKAKFERALRQAQMVPVVMVREHEGAEEEPRHLDPKIVELANLHPEAAVLISYRDMESWLYKLHLAFDLPHRRRIEIVAKELVGRAFDQSFLEVFNELRKARNIAAHVHGKALSREDALEYAAQTQMVVESIKHVLEHHTPKETPPKRG